MSLSAENSYIQKATLLTVWLVALAAIVTLAVSAMRPLPRFKWFLDPPGWPLVAVLALGLPCAVLPLLAYGFHYLDRRYGGGGIKDRIGRLTKPHSKLASGNIAATMTKQSILAAIAAIFLTEGEGGSLASQSYPEFATALSRLGFSVALLLLTVSVLAYDYANRFRLCREECYELVRKGLELDVFAWYILLASFIVSMAAQHPERSIVISIATGFLVRWYYFLSPREFGGRSTYKDPYSSTAKQIQKQTLNTTDSGA